MIMADAHVAGMQMMWAELGYNVWAEGDPEKKERTP